MRSVLIKTTALTLLSSSLLLASGWRIPEQSANSVALSGAYIANASGADSSYNNPANMSFNEDKHQAELSLMYIHLTSIEYKDNRSPLYNSDSKKENFIVPTTFLTSKDYDGIRYGLSITAPGGLSKRWDEAYAKTYAEEFTLEIVELNPVVSYLISDNLSIAGGLRFIYSNGVVKSDGGTTSPIKRDMEGNTIEYGYNLALSYRPTSDIKLAATYRSNIDLGEEGNAKLYLSGSKVYDGGSSVSVPLPAVLSLAVSYDVGDTTLELEYDKTYWSEYKTLDFEYDSTVPLALQTYFDAPKAKDWIDTDAFRLGLTHKYSNEVTLMAGIAIDENPAQKAYTSFELPDSDAMLYSFGFNYKIDETSTFGFAYLYDKKESIDIKNDHIDGTFSNATAHLLSMAYRVDF